MTAEQVAELLQVPKSWVHEATRERRISHVRLGRYIRFEHGEIENWLAQLRVEGRMYRARTIALPT
jgi:excisionase family DNA binding protein